MLPTSGQTEAEAPWIGPGGATEGFGRVQLGTGAGEEVLKQTLRISFLFLPNQKLLRHLGDKDIDVHSKQAASLFVGVPIVAINCVMMQYDSRVTRRCSGRTTTATMLLISGFSGILAASTTVRPVHTDPGPSAVVGPVPVVGPEPPASYQPRRDLISGESCLFQERRGAAAAHFPS